MQVGSGRCQAAGELKNQEIAHLQKGVQEDRRNSSRLCLLHRARRTFVDSDCPVLEMVQGGQMHRSCVLLSPLVRRGWGNCNSSEVELDDRWL